MSAGSAGETVGSRFAEVLRLATGGWHAGSERGHPSKGRAQLANSVVEQASVNESHPVVLLSFEQLPAAAKSGLDRALTIEVTRSSPFKPGAFTDFAATGQSGALQVAYFGYLRDLAQRIAAGPIELAEWLQWRWTQRWPGDPEAAMRAWVLFLETARDNFSRRGAERVPGRYFSSPPRRRQLGRRPGVVARLRLDRRRGVRR